MRLLVQRVKEASVTVDNEIVGSIGHGLLVFLGIHKDDQPEDTSWLVQKLVNLRLFSDEEDKMNRSVQEVGGGVLVVSQFTLYGTCSKGRRPEFTQSASGEQAHGLYQKFVSEIRNVIPVVATGRFAAKMEVKLINDGPITLILDKNPSKSVS